MVHIEIVIAIVALAVLFGVVVPIVTAHLVKKRINIQPVLDKMDDALSVADNVVDGIKKLAPSTPGISAVDKIIEWSQKMVEGAEQLTKSQQLLPDQRKENAIAAVEACLKTAGIAITPEYEKIIAMSVEAAVDALPKTGDDVKAAAVAALTPSAEDQPEQTSAPKTDEAVAENPAVAQPVTLDALNQAAATINAAIAEKTAEQGNAGEPNQAAPAPTITAPQPTAQPESGAVAPDTTGTV